MRSSLALALMVALNCVAYPLTSPTALGSDAPPAPPSPAPAAAPANPQESMLNLLQVRQAWAITQGRPDVIVGVIDSGFDFYHPALKDKVLPGYFYPEGYHTDFFANLSHGTLVASIIVAQKTDNTGMTGLAPGCTVLTASAGMLQDKMTQLQRQWRKEHPAAQATVSAMQEITRAHEQELAKFQRDWNTYEFRGDAEAIRYLVDHGARVINMSQVLQRSACPPDLIPTVWKQVEDAFAYAAQKNVVIVLGAGNDDIQVEDYPGTSETVIVAGASNLDDTRWIDHRKEIAAMGLKQGSCFGKRLNVLAPTQDIMVCMPHEKRFYSCDDGPMGPQNVPFQGLSSVDPFGATSCAAPIVTSLAALVVSARPDLSARDVVAIINAGADDIGDKGYDLYTGYGRINFAKTLQIAQTWNKGPKPGGM